VRQLLRTWWKFGLGAIVLGPSYVACVEYASSRVIERGFDFWVAILIVLPPAQYAVIIGGLVVARLMGRQVLTAGRCTSLIWACLTINALVLVGYTVIR
jgi:hypothetical protein